MVKEKRTLLFVNCIGGTAVLASYAWGFISHPGKGGALWGNVPQSLIPLYTISMLAAAAGYIVVIYFILSLADQARVRIAGRFSYRFITGSMLLILVPSALWMPLSFSMLNQPTIVIWLSIRLVLFLVGIGSSLLLFALMTLRPSEPKWKHRIAVSGAFLFWFQTGVMDALIWAAYFPSKM